MHAKSINAFPPEILSLIFKEVHLSQLEDLDTTVRGHSADQNPTDEDESPTVDDRLDVSAMLKVVQSPTFFPYSVASVCNYWEEVLSSTPSFWNVVVIFLDLQGPNGTDSDTARKYLNWSNNLPIDVFITRNEQDKEDNFPLAITSILESKVAASFFQVLMPHFERCRTLHVDLRLSDSLPILPKFLPSAAPNLRHLSFVSNMEMNMWDNENSSHYFFDEPLVFNDIPPDANVFEFKPSLTTLVIDGRNVQHAFANGYTWLSDLPHLKVLKIADYSPMTVSKARISEGELVPHTCAECRLSLYNLLRAILSCKELEELTLESLSLYVETSEDALLPEDTFSFTSLEHITMNDIEPDIVHEMLRVTEQTVGSLTFIQCPRLGDAALPYLMQQVIRLVYLDEDVDLKPFLKGCETDTLVVIDSPCFSDDVLEVLSIQEGKLPNNRANFPYCSDLSNLHLHFTDPGPSYTVAAVKRMVEARGREVDYMLAGWPESFSGMPLRRLLATGQVPELQPEDEEWFRARLLMFQWGGLRVDPPSS